MGLTAAEGFIRNDIFQKRNVGLHAADAELTQRAVHALAGHREIAAHRGDLHQHRVVEWRDHRAGVARGGIEADAKTGGRAVVENAAVVGREIFLGILGGDAALDRKAIARDLILRGDGHLGAEERFAAGDEDLRTHEVDASDALGDGVLDLDARVHLDEEPVVLVHVIEELDGARVVVADAFGEIHRSVAKLLAYLRIQVHRRRDFDDFLISALHRAIALVKVHDIAMLVSEDLDLDVFGAGNVAFEENCRIAKRILRLVLCLAQKALQKRGLFHHPHATTTAAEGSLDDQRKTNFVRCLERLIRIGDRLLGAGQRWHLIAMRQRPRRGLVAHVFQQLRRWPDECDALTRTCSCELSIFRKKSIARMNHRHALLLGERDDALDIEIRTDRTL